MKVLNNTEITDFIGRQERLVLYGKLSLVRIILRYLKKENLIQKVAAVSIQHPKKRNIETILGCPVLSIKRLAEDYKEIPIIIVNEKEQILKASEEAAVSNGFTDCYTIDYHYIASLGAKEHVHLDFLCVGFVKCGTSSLHAALKKNKNIFLPKKKETLYLGSWRNRFDDGPERFNSIYFSNVPAEKVVGNIEPSYHACASAAYECYGPDTKIIFVVRNPASATYSYFKMLMRKTEEMIQVNYYKKYHKFNVKMFDDYIADYITSGKDTRFCYMDWIDEYLQFYSKENIKVVIFEDLIHDTEAVMNDIQEFIGAKPKTFTSLPHSNEGKSVSKNYISARINRYLYRRDRELRYVKDEDVKRRHEERKAKIHKHTLIDNDEKMLSSSKETLDAFYHDSISRLEEFCGRSLKGLWY